MTIDAVRAGLLSGGTVSGDELDELIALLGEPGLLEPGFTFVGVWGRKPHEQSPARGVQ
jgi:hypothetical protein